MKINEIEKSNSRYIGKKVQYFETIDSTHKYAKRNIDNINNGSIIIAEAQTGGIGTKGRIWYTGKENNIAMTIVLKPDKKVEELENLTVDIAKAIQKAIQELYNIEFLDHIIVGENKYLSMSENKAIDRNYEDNRTDLIDKISLIEENTKLKEKIQILDKKVQKYEKVVQRDDEEYE